MTPSHLSEIERQAEEKFPYHNKLDNKIEADGLIGNSLKTEERCPVGEYGQFWRNIFISGAEAMDNLCQKEVERLVELLRMEFYHGHQYRVNIDTDWHQFCKENNITQQP